MFYTFSQKFKKSNNPDERMMLVKGLYEILEINPQALCSSNSELERVIGDLMYVIEQSIKTTQIMR